MTALTLAPDAARAPRPLPWRRLILVTWLQHRGVLIGVAARGSRQHGRGCGSGDEVLVDAPAVEAGPADPVVI